MRRGLSTGATYVLACVLLAAVVGRLVDQSARLPGVHEASAVRGGSAAWIACLATACVLGCAAAHRWAATRSIRSTARIVVPGQLGVFLAGEVVVRVSCGRGPFDPDALVGGALQGLLALLLLLALAVLGIVLLRCRPMPGLSLPPTTRLPSPRPETVSPAAQPRLRSARAPPRCVLV